MGKNIRIFHIEIIYLIGCNITAVIVIILTKSTFELFDQLIPKIRTYLDSGVQQFCILFWFRICFGKQCFGRKYIRFLCSFAGTKHNAEYFYAGE